MKLSQISIDGFRTFKKPTTIDLTDVYTAQVNNRIIFVGTNASGKTTLLEIITSLIKAYHGKEDDMHNLLLKEAKSVSVGFENELGAKIRLEINQKGQLVKEGSLQPPYYIFFPGDRSLTQASNKQNTVWGYEYTFDPNFLKSELKNGLSGLTSKFFAGRKLAFSGNNYTLTASRDNPTPVPLTNIPSGEKQALIILTIINKYLKPNSIVIIDEFEVSLHPTAQRRLFHLLSEKLAATNSQLIIATHSVEIVRAAKETEVFSLDEILGGDN